MRGFGSLLLATVLVACGTSTEPERTGSDAPKAVGAGSATGEGAASSGTASNDAVAAVGAAVLPADARYLVDPESGAVAMDVPPAILADVRAQLVAAGRTDAADGLARLYDPATGHVRDEAKAKATNATLLAAIAGGAR